MVGSSGEPSPRTEFVYNIDELNSPLHSGPGASRSVWQVAVRRGVFKLIWGDPRQLKLQKNKKTSNKTKTYVKDLSEIVRLFNVESDPSESRNLAKDPQYTSTLEDLKRYGLQMSTQMVKDLRM